MTTEEKGQTNEREGKCPEMACCSPQRFAEMMAMGGEVKKCECGPMMQEMMKGAFGKPERK